MVSRSKSDRLYRIDRTKHTCARVVTVVDTVLCQFHFEFKFPIYMIFNPLKTVRPIYRTGVPLPSRCCIIYFFSTNMSTEYFKYAAHSPFFSSKCHLFHNATFVGSCIIHILRTGCAKI
jgi:hypothetical protein